MNSEIKMSIDSEWQIAFNFYRKKRVQYLLLAVSIGILAAFVIAFAIEFQEAPFSRFVERNLVTIFFGTSILVIFIGNIWETVYKKSLFCIVNLVKKQWICVI